MESYSVLTRLPGGLAVEAAVAARTLAERFPARALRLDEDQLRGLTRTLADANVFGGASYDGLVALEANTGNGVLLTLDKRATSTYQRLRVPFRLIGS